MITFLIDIVIVIFDCYMAYKIGKLNQFNKDQKTLINPALEKWGRTLDLVRVKDGIIYQLEQLVDTKDKTIKLLEDKLNLCHQSKSRNK